MQRRQFISGLGCASAAGLLPRRACAVSWTSASERIRVGWIGCGGRGTFVARHFHAAANVEIAAVCDVHEPNAARARQWVGSGATAYADFRRVLDRRDIDAVLVATPDHWHAIPTVLACQAGKDVYVEKPLGHNVREGRAMVDAARKSDRIVQTGTQQRSTAHFQKVRDIIQSGQLGKVHYVRIWNFKNSYPTGIGRAPDSAAPAGLDWDFYLGPAPLVPFNVKRFLGTFRFFWDYAGGIATDWGTHRFDVMHQIMGVTAPQSVAASGGRFALEDAGEVPDVLQATFEYPGFLLSYECTLLNAFGMGTRTPGMRYYQANGPDDRPNGLAFYGTSGALFADRLGFEIFPELRPGHKASEADRNSPEHFRMQRQEGSTPDSTGLHVQNFLDCVRSRQKPAADVELGHHASTVAHLANIAYKTGRKLRWDPQKEQFLDDPDAARHLQRQPRKPWDIL